LYPGSACGALLRLVIRWWTGGDAALKKIALCFYCATYFLSASASNSAVFHLYRGVVQMNVFKVQQL